MSAHRAGADAGAPTALQTVLLLPPSPHPPLTPVLLRALTASPELTSLHLDGLAGWRALAGAEGGRGSARSWLCDVGVLDLAAGASPLDALEAAAEAADAAGLVAETLPAGEIDKALPTGARLALPRRAAALWAPEGGGWLDAGAAGDAAVAAAARAGAAVWRGWALAGWGDAGSHWRLREGAPDGVPERHAEVERLVLPADGGGAAFGVAFAAGGAAPAAAARAWTRASCPQLPAIACHGLAEPVPDAPAGGPAERWALAPASGGGVVLRWPTPPLDARAAADAAAAGLAACAAVVPAMVGARVGGTRVDAARCITTADGAPLLGWAPLPGEAGRSLLLGIACGGTAGALTGDAAAPALADGAAAMLAGAWPGEAWLDPARAAAGAVSTPVAGDPWELDRVVPESPYAREEADDAARDAAEAAARDGGGTERRRREA